MRTIKFRGFNAKNSKWMYGSHIINRGKYFVAPDEFADDKTWEDYEVEPETIGQFTGLHDKNGKEIYEGDIIRHKDMVKPYHVIYDGHQFTPNDGFRSLSYPKHWEVIGNIHDNPELLKGGEQ
jgi:uncharacterized phage protein (TIGR01671 family)